MLKRLAVLARSMIAGAIATSVDLASLFVMVTLLGLSPRIANVPALLLAAVAMFIGQRHLAFRATEGAASSQALRFVCVHAVTLTLNAVLFDIAVRSLGSALPYWLTRLVVSNAIFLTWSFPMLRRVFRRSGPSAERHDALLRQ